MSVIKTTTNLETLKINYLTQEMYDEAVENDEINENELYFVDDLEPTVEFTCTRNSTLSGGESRGIYNKISGIVSINFYCNSDVDITTTQELFNIPLLYRPSEDKGGTGMLKNSGGNVAATALRARTSSGSIVQLGSDTARSVYGIIEYKL